MNSFLCIQCAFSEVFQSRQKLLLLQVRQKIKHQEEIQQYPCQSLLNIMFPLLNFSHKHPSEEKEQLSNMKD